MEVNQPGSSNSETGIFSTFWDFRRHSDEKTPSLGGGSQIVAHRSASTGLQPSDRSTMYGGDVYNQNASAAGVTYNCGGEIPTLFPRFARLPSRGFREFPD